MAETIDLKMKKSLNVRKCSQGIVIYKKLAYIRKKFKNNDLPVDYDRDH